MLSEASSKGSRVRRTLHFAAFRQGRYMGMMRGLKPRHRTHMKRIKEAKGIEAAIRAAERMA